VERSAKQRRILRRPSPAMVVACIGLAVALSGTGYAVTALPRGSVGTAQLKANAVNSQKVKNGSLLGADFKAGQLPAGAPGPTGPAGPASATGPTGANRLLFRPLSNASTAFSASSTAMRPTPATTRSSAGS